MVSPVAGPPWVLGGGCSSLRGVELLLTVRGVGLSVGDSWYVGAGSHGVARSSVKAYRPAARLTRSKFSGAGIVSAAVTGSRFRGPSAERSGSCPSGSPGDVSRSQVASSNGASGPTGQFGVGRHHGNHSAGGLTWVLLLTEPQAKPVCDRAQGAWNRAQELLNARDYERHRDSRVATSVATRSASSPYRPLRTEVPVSMAYRHGPDHDVLVLVH
jgi:hypothetical protein